MAPFTPFSSTDPGEMLEVAGDHLAARPTHHNLMLSILHDRLARPEPGRYWWVTDGFGSVAGAALQSPLTFSAAMGPAGRNVAEALVDVMAAGAPDLPGVIAEAATAAAVAGRWAERLAVPVFPHRGQRIYRLGELRTPAGVPGTLRRATPEDLERLKRWVTAFFVEVASGPAGDPLEQLERRERQQRLWIWEHHAPVSMAFATPPVAGVSRISLVYTPPEHRRHGYASACVAELAARTLSAEAEQVILYTELDNPTSNSVYRRIGFEPLEEVLSYRFGRPADRSAGA